MLEALKLKVKQVGKPLWRDVLVFLAELHERSIHGPVTDLPYLWEEIIPEAEDVYLLGHWDTVHVALDTLTSEPQHALYQILNILELQQEDGFIPGHLWVQDGRVRWNAQMTSPPLWPVVVQDYVEITGNTNIIAKLWGKLLKQIEWFETHRKVEEEGFHYIDILDRFWESGVEDGVRYDLGDEVPERLACVDATSHMFLLYDFAARWAALVGKPATPWEAKRTILQHWIQTNLFDDEAGFFRDNWSHDFPDLRLPLTFEGMWPLIVGAASPKQAARVINEHLLNSQQFFGEHPVPSVSMEETEFQLYHWRGPVRNSMTYWAARACLRYQRKDAAEALLERALNMTALHFAGTGSIWEFYHPEGMGPDSMLRPNLGDQAAHMPFENYLGHNPLIAMAELWANSTDSNSY